MPFIHVKVGSALTEPQARRIQAGITTLMAEAMRKQAALTSVLVERAYGFWSIGGAPRPIAAHVDAYVTAGTNAAAEKAALVAAVDALLRAELGAELPGATYVIVHEIAADAWGYGGMTQAGRREAAHA